MPEKVSFQGLQDFSARGAVKCLLPGNRRPSQQEGNVKKLCVWAVGKILTSNFPSLELQFFDGKLKQYSLFCYSAWSFQNMCKNTLYLLFVMTKAYFFRYFIHHCFVLRFQFVGRCMWSNPVAASTLVVTRSNQSARSHTLGYHPLSYFSSTQLYLIHSAISHRLIFSK
jgi:hypothetical protein